MIPVSSRPLLASRKSINPFVLFAIEGALLQMCTSINGVANNLFATALGATDLQIGLVQMIPNAVAVLLLLPLGILADRLRSSRTVPLICLIGIAAGYGLMTLVPSLGGLRIPAFFFALAFTAGGPALYNGQWQTFFGDVVPTDSRNDVLTLRNRLMMAMAILAPLTAAAVMARSTHGAGMYRVFFALCLLAAVVQLGVISGIHTPLRQNQAVRFRMEDLVNTIRTLAASRQFLLFFGPVLFFYMSWQMDWSMWYIGQVQYLHLTEAQITVYSGLFNIGQLFAIGLLSRTVQKRGVDRTLPYAALGLVTTPLVMVLCTRLPQAARMPAFTLLMMILDAPQCAVNLCVVQILLRVVPRNCRSIAVSLYTLVITLSNCLVPYLGVRLYTALGSDYRALLLFNLAVFLVRIVSTGLLIWRCKYVETK